MVIIQILISKCPVKDEFDPLAHNLQEIKSLDDQVKHVKYVKKASGQAGEVSYIGRHGVITFYDVQHFSVEAGGIVPWSTVD